MKRVYCRLVLIPYLQRSQAKKGKLKAEAATARGFRRSPFSPMAGRLSAREMDCGITVQLYIG